MASLHLKVQKINNTQALCERKELNLIAENSNKWTALSFAAEKGNVEIIEFLIKVISERFGRESLRKLLNKVDKHGQTSLYIAASMGHVKMVRFLLSLKQTDVNLAKEDGMISLHTACNRGHLKVVKVKFFTIC